MTRAARFSLISIVANKPDSELSNESLLTIVNCQDGQQEPTARFYMYIVGNQVAADDLTVQCEHINHELWLFLTAD